MSRPAPRSRNALNIARFLTVLVAVTAVVVGTVAPVAVATASASQSTTASLARTAGDPAQTGIVKTSLAGFSAGNIISDAVFTNKSTMTEAQIQSFFNGKVSRCQSGYVCLKDFKISSVNRPADAYCSGYTGAANESAARIIYRVAQSCNINPQVLIVMLQKEQGLISHTWPSSWRYDSALGQGCPDTAPCDPNFVGFFHQIYGAARQMQIYMEGKWFQWYAPGKTWGILYHPNSSCGRGNVYVANKATAALYYYTPYQPNAAALRAGFGEGDSCSSYGNRNFYNYFTDWFGSTQSSTPSVPSVPPPVLTDLNSTSYVLGADKNGEIWGYPFTKSTWGSRVKLAGGLGVVTAFFSVGDLDGDGKRDYIAQGITSQPSLLRGGASTTLSAAAPLAGDWTGVKSVLPAGDFNGDGLQDIFTISASGELYLRAGNGQGGFRPSVLVGSGWSVMNKILGGVDFDGDSVADLIARDAKGNLYLYPASGNGSFRATAQIGNGWSSMTDIFSPGDFNGDGKADLLAHGADGQLSLYQGTGGGRLAAVGPVGNGWQALATKASAGPAITPLPALPAGIGNIDGVAGVDVVAVAQNGNASVYGGSGTGSWSGVTSLATGWGSKDKIVALGDFNGDGHPDFGRVDASGQFLLYSGKSQGGVAAPVRIGHGWSGFAHLIGGVDFDGDRRTDVLAIDSGGVMHLYRGNGAGGWGAGRTQVGTGWNVMSAAFHAGDFDNDGRGDVIARLADGTLRMYPMTGSGSWAQPVQIGNGWAAFTKIFSPGDFNGDGKNDVLAIDTSGSMYLYPGLGNTKFGVRKQVGNGWQTMSPIG